MNDKLKVKDVVENLLNFENDHYTEVDEFEVEIANDQIRPNPSKPTCLWSDVDLDDKESEMEYKPDECGFWSEKEKEELFEEYAGDEYELLKNLNYNPNDEFIDKSTIDKLNENEIYSVPIFKKVKISDLVERGVVDAKEIEKYKEILKKYDLYSSKNWYDQLSNPPPNPKKRGSDECPASCEVVTLQHGTSLKRAKSIQENGFFDITKEKESDLNCGKIGMDMRECYGGVGEHGVTFFFVQGHGTPLKHHGKRVAKVDEDEPAVIQMDACMCNILNPYQTINPKFIAAIKKIAKEKSTNGIDKSEKFNVRFYSVRETTNPIDVLQRLSTTDTPMSDIMDEFGFDGVYDTNSVLVLRDPNTSLIPSSFKICTEKNYDVNTKKCR